MGLTSKIAQPIYKKIASSLISVDGGNLVSAAIARAFNSKGFNRSYANAFAAWYFTKTASLAGVVQDETPNRDHSRPELTSRATSFTTNQKFQASARATSDNSTVTLVCWFKSSSSSGQNLLSEYDTTDDNRQFYFGLNSTGNLRLSIFADGSGPNTASEATDNTFNDGTWHHGVAVLSGGGIALYVDGRLEASTTTTGGTGAASFYDGSAKLVIGSTVNNALNFEGSIQHPAIWESALTAAQVRDLYLNKLDSVPTPDHAWFLDGDKCWTIAGDSVLSPSNTPTRLESEDIPVSGNDFNHAGWSFENKLRLKNTYTTGDTFTFEIKTTSDRFIILNNPSNSVMAIQWDGGSTSTAWERQSDNLTINGELFTGANRDDLFDEIASGAVVTVEFELTSHWIGETVEMGNFTAYELDDGYCRLTHINGVPITAEDIDFDNITEIIPAQWQSNTLDALGNTLQYSGEVARNGTLIDGPCADLNGTNQYGVITNSDDYSGEDWVLTARVDADSVLSDIKPIFGQSSGKLFLNLEVGGKVSTYLDGVKSEFSNDAIDIAFSYLLTLNKSGSSYTLTTENLDTGITQVSSPLTITMTSSTGNLLVGNNSADNRKFNGKIWGLKLDCTTDPTKSFNCPISEESGDTSYDISGNGKNIAWQNTPSLSGTQDSFFHGEHFGCNSVPIFENAIYLDGPTVNFDGVKRAYFEFDFTHKVSTVTQQHLASIGSATPLRISVVSDVLRVIVRDSANSTNTSTFLHTFSIGENVSIGVEILEDEDNPTTAGSVILTDLTTGLVLESFVGLDINLSSSSNNGDIRLSAYSPNRYEFLGDMYRFKCVVGATEKALMVFPSFANQVDGEDDFTETGGTLDIKKIPAKEDGSNTDANGYPIQNTSPSHKNTQATLQGYLTNSDSEADIYYGCEFNGSSSKIQLADDFDWALPWTFEFDMSTATISGVSVLFFSTSTSYSVKLRNGAVEIRLNSVNHLFDESLTVDVESHVKLDSSGGNDAVLSVDIDGTTESIELIPASISWASEMTVGQQPGDINPFEGTIRNLKITNNGSAYYECPLYKDSLDRSSNCNHGTDTAITYLNNPATEIAALNPTIASTETLAQTDGNKKLILIGAK